MKFSQSIRRTSQIDNFIITSNVVTYVLLPSSKLKSPMIIAIIAIFAALYFILSLLPGIPVVGFPAIKIQLEASIASIYGVLLGPYLGAFAAFLGALIATLYGSITPFSLIFIFNPAANALTSGFLAQRKWSYAFTIFALTILGFWLTPVSNPIVTHWYVALAATFDKIIALMLILLLWWYIRGGKVLSTGMSMPKLTLSLFIIAFIGNQMDSALGCLIFALPPVYHGLFGLSTETTRMLFTVSPLIYPAIRLLQAIVASILGLPLVKAFEICGLGYWVERRETRKPLRKALLARR